MFVSANTEVDGGTCPTWSLLLLADTVLGLSLLVRSFVYVGGPDAGFSAVYWNVGTFRCQNAGQESWGCLFGTYLDGTAWDLRN